MTFCASSRRDDADGLHRPDEFVDALGREQVLLDLVGDDAEAGFLDGEPREFLGARPGAAAIASTMRSIWSWESSARAGAACLARCASRRASWTEARSRSVGGGSGAGHRIGQTTRVGRARAGQHALDLGVRPRNHVDGDEFADAAGRGGTGVGRGLDRADVAAREHRDVAGADVLLADEHDVGGLDHRIGGFDGADQAAGFNHSEGV